MVDCLQHAVDKENEIPKIIEIIFNGLKENNVSNINQFNKKMRTKEEILKDYGLGGV